MSLEFVSEWGLRSLIWNPSVDTWEQLMVPQTDEHSQKNAFSIFKQNPGLLFACSLLAVKYLGINLAARNEYAEYLDNRSPENFSKLWQANPGLLGGALMSLEFVSEWGLRSLIWNPSVDTWKHLMVPKSEEDSRKNAFSIFKQNPGFLFACTILGMKYFGINFAASREYKAYLKDRSLDNFIALWKSNPGVLGGLLMTLEFPFEWGLRALIWNPKFAAKDFMFARDASLKKDVSLIEFGRLSDKWPGLIYGLLLLSVKYGLVNFSARDEYLAAFKAIGGIKELGTLFTQSPGVAAVTIFVVIKFFEEIGAKVLFDPRLLEEYNKFWEAPSLETAQGLFKSGVVGASLFAIGKGINSLFTLKTHLAGLIEQG